MIDARLLAMPAEYRSCGEAILRFTHDLASLRVKRQTREAELKASLIASWQDKATAGNKESRDAQVEALLATDPEYGELLDAVQACEEGIKTEQTMLDALKFEFHCLEVVANNDHAAVPVSGPSIATTWIP